MSITLRPYQEDGINELSKGWKDYKRQVLALTTGGGKTVIFTEIAKRTTNKNKRVLILTHREELFKQAKTTFEKAELNPEIINAKQKNIDTSKLLFIAMVETISRRTKLVSEIKPDLIIIDECHIGNFTKILDLYPNVYTLGVTATPVGKHFYTHYNNIVQTIDTPDLIDLGYLVPCRAFQMIREVTGLKTQNGEFTPQSMMNFFDKSILYNGVVDAYKEKALGKKTIIFNCNIKHSDTMAQTFINAGFECKSLTSNNTQEERKVILNWFENTSNAILCNAGILTAGYDHPPIECVIVNRATKSLPLWLQMVGRGSRINFGKDSFILLDFGGNHERHGMWNEYRKWKIEPPKEKKEGAMPLKQCHNDNCNCVTSLSTLICPECLTPFPIKEKILETGTLIEVKKDKFKGRLISELTADELAELTKEKLFYAVKSSMIWRVVRNKGIEFLKEYGRKMSYKNGWFFKQKEQLNDSNYIDFKIKRIVC